MLKISLETLLNGAVPINSFFLVCIFLLLHFLHFIVSLLMIVKLLRLELYGNDIYTSIQAIIRRYRTIVSLLMIVLD